MLAAGLAVLWIANSLLGEPGPVDVSHLLLVSPALDGLSTVAFYVFTALGPLLLTSGLWVVTSERFALRDAKRLFGMIGAGGTLGAMLAGISLAHQFLGCRCPIRCVFIRLHASRPLCASADTRLKCAAHNIQKP